MCATAQRLASPHASTEARHATGRLSILARFALAFTVALAISLVARRVFALAAAVAVILPEYAVRCLALGAGALAASASDTWATEIGTLHGAAPRSILGLAPVPIGMSGGLTLAGSLGAFAGAALIALVL